MYTIEVTSEPVLKEIARIFWDIFDIKLLVFYWDNTNNEEWDWKGGCYICDINIKNRWHFMDDGTDKPYCVNCILKNIQLARNRNKTDFEYYDE